MSTPTALLASAFVAAACSAALIVGADGLSDGTETVILEGAADDAASLTGPTETLVINLDGFGSVPAEGGLDRTVDGEIVPDEEIAADEIAANEEIAADEIAADEIAAGDEIEETGTSVAEYEWMPPQTEPWRVAVLIVRHFDFEVDGERHVYEMKGNRLRRSRQVASDLRRHLTDESMSETGLFEVDVMELDDPLTSITPHGDGYMFSEGDLGDILDTYAPDGAYHAVIVVIELDRNLAGGGPVYVAEPSAGTNGATLAVVRARGDQAAGRHQWQQWFQAIGG